MKPDPFVDPAPGGAAIAAPATQRLWALTWANLAAHGAGLVLALVGMRPGSVVVPLEARMAYLAGEPRAWAWGWGVWMLCSLLLVAWLAVLRDLLPERSPAARLALLLAAAGMAVDLLCDVLQAAVLPGVAARAAAGATDLFIALERLAFTGGATVANGLYTAAVLLMTLALAGTVGAAARWAGFATVAAGLAMAVAGLLPSPALLEAATGPTIGFYSVWTVLVARGLRSPAPRRLPVPATAR
jgi:hypothetical protein